MDSINAKNRDLTSMLSTVTVVGMLNDRGNVSGEEEKED
jgi:hypothetical protein